MLTDAGKATRKAKVRGKGTTGKSPSTGPARKVKAAPRARVAASVRVKPGSIRRANLGHDETGVAFIAYNPAEGVGRFVESIRGATPMQLVEVERAGIGARLLKDVAAQMGIPARHFFSIMGIPKATAEKKASANLRIAGSGGQAALGMVKLLGIAQSIVDNSTAEAARGFDAARWLGQWIERPQPALGGKKPAEILDTPTGIELVSRVLGAIESGAYL